MTALLMRRNKTDTGLVIGITDMKNIIIYAIDGKSDIENIVKACSDADV